MPTPTSSITRGFSRKEKDKLNILTFCSHERYENGLSKTLNNFYAWRVLDKSIKDWDTTYAPLPSNYTLLDPKKGTSQIPNWLDFDLVLSQNKFGQFQIARQIANQLQLPLLSLEHTQPVPHWTQGQLQSLYNMKGNLNVFISEFSRKAWGWREDEAEVVHHGIDTELFKPLGIPKKKHILSVCNDFINRDMFCGFKLWQTVTKDLPVHPVGKTPGLSFPAKDLDELVKFYNEAQVFINTSLVSPIPTSLLEAMSCSVAIVTTGNCMMPEIVENGYNGYISNDPQELRRYCIELLNNPEKCKQMGANARQTILDRFSMDKFVDNWNKIFYKTAQIQNLGTL